eukprot:2033318-Pleurochrysis_carterae.AAC.3
MKRFETAAGSVTIECFPPVRPCEQRKRPQLACIDNYDINIKFIHCDFWKRDEARTDLLSSTPHKQARIRHRRSGVELARGRGRAAAVAAARQGPAGPRLIAAAL